MLYFDREGMCSNPRIRRVRKRKIERDPLGSIKGIIVHQTSAAKADSTLEHYENGVDGKLPNGAHFLIDRDGTIMQTASILRQTQHVGRLKSRCVWARRCSPGSTGNLKTHRLEMQKSVPERFPSNMDSVGIEIVGEAIDRGGKEPVFESVNDAQNLSLKWLVSELVRTFSFSIDDVFPHLIVSRKNETEASTAKWRD